MRKLFVSVIVLLIMSAFSEVPSLYAIEPGLISKQAQIKSEVQVKKPRSASKAKRKQEAKEKKQKKDYGNYVKGSQKRSIAIQTPEVQARMKQNQKDSDSNYKSKKKKSTASTKKAGKKYKK